MGLVTAADDRFSYENLSFLEVACRTLVTLSCALNVSYSVPLPKPFSYGAALECEATAVI